jgi:hypothetical protein
MPDINPVMELIYTLQKADNEGTEAPYWLILDPKQNMNCDIHNLAFQITGPYFSREDAENFLWSNSHTFGKNADVFCVSGCYSEKYFDFYKKITG